MKKQIKDASVLLFLKDYWFLLIFLVSAILFVARTETRVATAEKQLASQEIKVATNEGNFNALNIKLAEIGTQLGFVLQKLDKINP